MSDVQTWTVPFTAEQLALLGSTPCQFVDGMVVCVKMRPEGEKGWAVQSLPVDPAQWAEYEPGARVEVCFADIPMSEFEGLADFEGW